MRRLAQDSSLKILQAGRAAAHNLRGRDFQAAYQWKLEAPGRKIEAVGANKFKQPNTEDTEIAAQSAQRKRHSEPLSSALPLPPISAGCKKKALRFLRA